MSCGKYEKFSKQVLREVPPFNSLKRTEKEQLTAGLQPEIRSQHAKKQAALPVYDSWHTNDT
jgi:hypothetical protein